MLKRVIIVALTTTAFAVDPGQPLGVDGGRFVFGQISEYRSDQYMLDTQTGRLWRIVMMPDSTTALQPIIYSDIRFAGGKMFRVTSELPLKPDSVFATPLSPSK